MAPPQLAADAPVLDVLEPIAISRFIFSGNELDVVVHNRRKSYFGKMLHVDKPLLRQARLDGHMGTLRAAHLVVVVLDFLHQAGSLQVESNLLANIETVHAHI